MGKRAVFVDRDGVINVERRFVHTREDFEFIPRAVRGLECYEQAGFAIVVVSNQSGIARGYYSEADFQALTSWMLGHLASLGVNVTAVYHCPHGPDDGCNCRKPRPGLLLAAAHDHDLDLSQSWLIGDKESDIEAGLAAGVSATFLVRSGHSIDESTTKALFVCDSLFDTVSHLDNGPPSSVQVDQA